MAVWRGGGGGDGDGDGNGGGSGDGVGSDKIIFMEALSGLLAIPFTRDLCNLSS